MQYEKLIIKIRDTAGLSSLDDADDVLRATLEGIGTAIPEPLADELAAQLPDEIARCLQPPALVAASGSGRLDRREFVHRIAQACHVNDDQAARIIPAVFAAIDGATGGMITHEVRGALPAEIRPAHRRRHRHRPGRHGHQRKQLSRARGTTAPPGRMNHPTRRSLPSRIPARV